MKWRGRENAERQLECIGARLRAPVSLEWALSADKTSDLLCVYTPPRKADSTVRGRCWLVAPGTLNTTPEERQVIETLAILRYNLGDLL